MITLDQARTLQGKTVYTAGGDKLGSIDTLYADREDGHPTFMTVHTGLFGTKTHFVPLEEAALEGDRVTVPYDKDRITGAPNIDEDSELSPEEEQRLYSYYGLTGGPGYTAAGTTGTVTSGEARGNVHGTEGRDVSGPTTDDAMTRSEEHLEVGKQRVEAGRARLRKWVETETETRTVPVAHEEIVVEREPITDGNLGKATDGPAISEEEHEVVLHEEKPVVAKEVTPVERVRLGTETKVDEVTVSDEVRKERIDTEGVYPEGGTTRSSDQNV